MNGRILRGRVARSGFLLLLATVFTVGLTFATLELPYVLDGFLQNTITTPGGDSHVDDVARLKTALFMAHFHVRAIGYAAFFLLVALIVLGFSTRRVGLARAGGVGIMLAAFAQFAGVMFFLAGLGVLNAIWLPILDISWELQSWGLIIRAPDDFLRWILGLFGLHSRWPTILLFTGAGVLIFVSGVYAWLIARSRGRGVADFWVYRISRHPQYLGWILWTYGAFLLIQLMRYPKRSWGIGASLPWLISTMVIVGVALLEELNMRRRQGEVYETYRRSAPFLLPLPRWVARIFAMPLRLFFRKERVERRREVAVVVGAWTLVLMAASAVFYAGGLHRLVARLTSTEVRAERVRGLLTQLEDERSGRRRYQLATEVSSYGDVAVTPLVDLLASEVPSRRQLAAELLVTVPSEDAVPALRVALSDSLAGVRFNAFRALEGLDHPVPREVLVAFLDDADAGRRHAALSALARRGDEGVLEKATAWLSDEHHWIRGQVLDALGVQGFHAALPLAVAGLADEHEWVRRAAVIALLRIGSPVARAALEGVLSDPDFEVRVYAAEALRRLPAARSAG